MLSVEEAENQTPEIRDMKNKTEGTNISGIGDEDAISKTETTHIWLVKTSNACIKVKGFGLTFNCISMCECVGETVMLW